ncbi:hypothetical protein L1987_72022 [Smallanthus sonchifolius]|uniref:Uncharacterized protein n=1 Tax=Smallanthus sonchifolius TaxID=185202 RepID=A0ACB9AUY5_9ASTR|nr:hypothetical protein L1987_72022 [Smallanthus sonchifolius]
MSNVTVSFQVLAQFDPKLGGYPDLRFGKQASVYEPPTQSPHILCVTEHSGAIHHRSVSEPQILVQQIRN